MLCCFWSIVINSRFQELMESAMNAKSSKNPNVGTNNIVHTNLEYLMVRSSYGNHAVYTLSDLVIDDMLAIGTG